MPFWSHVNSGSHQTDSTLQVHLHTHGSGRKRLDSVLSVTSLGEHDEDLVTLINPNVFGSLDEVLDKLPGESRSLRYFIYSIYM